jgi:hypothetical protein
MVGISSPFGGSPSETGDGDDELFDGYDEFVPTTLPEPGRHLADHDLLVGEAHLDFHETTRACFEERGVYDMTFGYNLARLNLDTRHRSAGFRYARDADDPSILWAEFTPTTPFCPQSDTLTKAAFRAWNGLEDRHDYDLVRVRLDEMHHRADEINETLAEMEDSTGAVDGSDEQAEADPTRGPDTRGQGGTGDTGGNGCSQGARESSRGYGADAPF